MTDTQNISKPLVNSEALSFIVHVPLVSGAVDYSYSVIKSHSILYRTFLLGENVLAKSLAIAEPITSRLSTPLNKADGLALQTLTFAKSKFPYPFEVKWDDLFAIVQKPVDQANGVVSNYRNYAQGLYDTHVKENAKNLYDQTNKAVEQLQQNENVYLQRAGNTIVSINENLTKIAQDWSKKSKAEVAEGEKKAQGLVNNLFSELENLQKFAKGLPTEGQKRLAPIIDTFSSTYKEVYTEAFDSKLPIQERVTKVTSYLRSETLPALHKVCTKTYHDTNYQALLQSVHEAEAAAGKSEKEISSKLDEVAKEIAPSK